MSMKELYGPEDIERLLLDKSFSALLAEEREYVLKHIEDESEYEHMRELLRGFSAEDEVISPPSELRSKLIEEHIQKHSRPSFKIWLNSLFSTFFVRREWYRPALQLAGVAALIIASVIVLKEFNGDLEKDTLVYEQEPSKVEEEAKELVEASNAQIQVESDEAPVSIDSEAEIEETEVDLEIAEKQTEFNMNNRREMSNELEPAMEEVASLDEVEEMDTSSDIIIITEDETEEELMDFADDSDLLEESGVREESAITGNVATIASTVPSVERSVSADGISEDPKQTKVPSMKSAPVSGEVMALLYTAW